MPLNIEVAVGYLLKVLKNGFDTSPFKDEFDAIRHGDYEAIMNLVDCEKPVMVVYHQGVIRLGENNASYDFEFEGLLKAGPALLKLYAACQQYYGYVEDNDLEDCVFQRCALFEIALRMHARNRNLLPNDSYTSLVDVINLLGSALGMEEAEIQSLHDGRKFINEIKHPKNDNFPWHTEVAKFEKALRILKDYNIVVC
jgi:hypothetical protein